MMCRTNRFFLFLTVLFIVFGISSTFVAAQNPASALVNQIRVSLDQSLTNTWNEIDAVELVGRDASGNLIRQWATSAEASSQYGPENYAASQATGEPNTTTCASQATAWASQGNNTQEWLLLTYATPVAVTEVLVYQTQAPGAITKIEALSNGTVQAVLFEGVDPARRCPGALRVMVEPPPASDSAPVYGVRVTINQTEGWSEIDAVELVGRTAEGTLLRQWAAAAIATSQYGVDNWSAAQAAGVTNTVTCADQVTAWAAQRPEGKAAITLLYAVPIFPVEVNVYQSVNPGKITRIELLSTDQQVAAFPIAGIGESLICPRVLYLIPASGAAAYLVPFYMWDARGAETVEGIGQALSFGHNPIEYGKTVTGDITMAAGANHSFQEWVFIGQTGDVVNIVMAATSPTLDAYLELLDSAGNVVATGDDTGDSLDARIEGFALPGSGLYTIRASGFGGGIGSFNLELNGVPAPPSQ
jgi:hypothetical protein